MTGGAFPPEVVRAIRDRDLDACVGCGRREPLTTQHRRARGMGGTRRSGSAATANGLTLCGSGTTGCHGWAEAFPLLASRLGWRVGLEQDPTEVPWCVIRGSVSPPLWQVHVQLEDRVPGRVEACVEHVDERTMPDVSAVVGALRSWNRANV